MTITTANTPPPFWPHPAPPRINTKGAQPLPQPRGAWAGAGQMLTGRPPAPAPRLVELDRPTLELHRRALTGQGSR